MSSFDGILNIVAKNGGKLNISFVFFSFAKHNFSFFFFQSHLVLDFAAWWRQITLLYANIDYRTSTIILNKVYVHFELFLGKLELGGWVQ